jgi:hypothetical protein
VNADASRELELLSQSVINSRYGGVGQNQPDLITKINDHKESHERKKAY